MKKELHLFSKLIVCNDNDILKINFWYYNYYDHI